MVSPAGGAETPVVRLTMDAKPIQLLLLEDNAGDARLIRDLLKEVGGPGFDVTLAARLADALEAVAVRRFDIILADLTLPDSRGPEAFRALRTAAPATPVVVLSYVDNEELALGAVRDGAQDYLAKGRLEPHLLGRSIRYAIERQHVEEQLQQKNIELASTAKVLQRSHAELKSAQLQLIQAEKMESLGNQAASVAHEIKNPLAILQMGINYLLKKISSTDENIAMVLQEMLDAIGCADAITHRMLDFAASQQLVMRKEDINELIEGALKLVRHALTDARVEVTRELADPPPRVMADRTQIQQVFVNLFMNATYAMPEGGHLTVRTFPKEMTETTHYEGSRKSTHLWVGDAVVVAEVLDSGSGILEENLGKIFDPFFTTKPTGQGTGLGLPISKKIIDLHGGSINIHNRPEGGVRAAVILKQAKEET